MFTQQTWTLNKLKMEPIYRLDKKIFWPDRSKMLTEANAVNSFELQEKDSVQPMLKAHPMGDDTPLLTEMWNAFTDVYGTFGHSTVSYFYIDPGMGNQGWHVDSMITTDTQSSMPTLCTMNLVITDESIPAEFAKVGKYNYVAAIFNTSHIHKVDTQGTSRVLARISFREAIYEEVVHRVKKIDNNITKSIGKHNV